MKSTNGTNKIIAMLLVWALLLSGLPMSAAAEGNSGCAHVHDGTCAYVEDADCGHVCDEDCADGCGHTEHDADCGYAEAVPCDHQHDAQCGGQTSGGLLLTSGYSVTAFDLLPPDVAARSVPLGTSMSALTLPNTLNATVVVDGAQGPEDIVIPGVTWQSAPEYEPDTAGTYNFTAVMPQGYDLADGVSLPAIDVTVKSGTQSGPSVTFDIPLNDSNETAFFLPEKEPITEADLLAGVTAKDETGADVSVTVQDTDGLDMADPQMRGAYPNPPYIITYAAAHPVTGDVFTEKRELYITLGEDAIKVLSEVSNYGDLQVACASTTGDNEVKLMADITNGADQLTIGRDLTLDLNGRNLTIAVSLASINGIKIAQGVTLTIKDSSPGENMLRVTNSVGYGSIDAPGNGAGINTTDGELIIESGTVVARGGYCAAGIGGGAANNNASGGDGGIITITGTAKVTAYGGNHAAGIGGGAGFNLRDGGKAGTIIISGSANVTAFGNGQGSGIGNGTLVNGPGGTVTISGNAVVTAESVDGAGIGGSATNTVYPWANASCEINISDNAYVKATSTGGGAGIGGGLGDGTHRGSVGNITVSGNATVIAAGSDGGAGIGGGRNIPGGSVTISGGTVTATGGSGGAGIGGGSGASNHGSVEITGGSVKSSSGGSPFASVGFATSNGTTPVYLTTVTAAAGTGNWPLVGAELKVNNTYTAYTDAEGKAYVWLPAAAGYTFAMSQGTNSGSASGVTVLANDTNILALHDSNTPATTLTPGAITSVRDDDAFVTFRSNVPGAYFYAVVASGALAPTVDTSGTGAACNQGANTIEVTGLPPGAKDIYIVVKRSDGNVSAPLKMTIPAQRGEPMWPNDGTDITLKTGDNITFTRRHAHNLIVPSGTTATIDGGGFALTGTLTLKGGCTVNIINLNIAMKGMAFSAIDVQGTGNTINFSGTNAMSGFLNATAATVAVPVGAALTLKSGGDGAFNVTARYNGAGIGGSSGVAAGTITIESGTVTASGNYGAGIGGGSSGAGGDIIIKGGIVTAHSGSLSAAIGGGNYSAGGNITISGGSVTATSTDSGAAIGGGNYSSAGGNITISGGSVTATSTGDGAGIGGGRLNAGSGGTIIISGGTVTASGKTGAGIGGGFCHSGIKDSEGGTVTISGGTVTASSTSGKGIGGGQYADKHGSAKITGGSVKSSSGGSPFASVGFATNGTNPVYLMVVTALSGDTPVAGATVTIGSYTAPTGADGKAYVWLPAGTSNFSAANASAGYTASANNQNITAADTNTVELKDARTTLSGTVTLTINPSTGAVTASATGGNTGTAGALTYTWSGGATGNNTTVNPTLGSEAVCTVVAANTTGYISASVTVYKVEVAETGKESTDSAAITNAYGKAGDQISIAYTLSNANTHNTLTYSGPAIPPTAVSTVGNGTSTYTIAAGDAVSGVIAITATFAHQAKTDVNGSINFTNGSATYNGAVQTHETASFTGTPSGTGGFTYTYAIASGGALEGGKPKGAGTYTVTATYEDDTQKGTATATFTINPKELSDVTVVANFPAITYDGTAQTPAPSSITFDGTTVSSGTDYTLGAYSNNTNAGTASVVINGMGNYTGTKTVNFTISPKNLSGVIVNANFPAITYNGYAQTPTPSSVTFDSTAAALNTGYTIGSYSSNTNAGTANAVITGAGNYTGTANVTFAIGAKSLTLTADNKTILVNDIEPAYTFSVSGLVGGDTEAVITTDPTFTLDRAFDSSSATTFTITITGGSTTNTNYTIGTRTNGTLTVTTKTPVTIEGLTAQDGTYNGQGHKGVTGTATSGAYTGALVYTYTGGDIIGSTTTMPINAGDYTLTVSVPDTDLSFSGSRVYTFTINKRAVTVKPKNESMTAGDQLPTFMLEYSGLVSGESITPSQAAAFSCNGDGSTAGSFTITWTNEAGTTFSDGTGKVDNYAIIKQTTGTLSVATAQYTVTVNGSYASTTGAGNYAPNATVTIYAGSRSNYSFNGWTVNSGGVTLANVGSATTTFTMPSTAVSVTANWTYTGGGGGSSYSPPATINGTVICNALGIPYSMTGGRLTSNITAQNLRSIVDKAYKNEDGGKIIKLDFSGVSGASGMTGTTLTFDASKLKADEDITFIIKTPFGVFIFTTEQMIKWFDGNTFGSYTITLVKSSLKVDVKKGGVIAVWNKLTPMGRIGVPYTSKIGENTANLAVTDKYGRVLPTSVYEKGMVYADIFAPGTYKAALLTPAAYSDTAGHWAKSYIDYVTVRGLLSGTSGTAFAPNTAITRADFLMALGKLSGVNVSSYKQSSFTDVSNSSAAMPYIEWAVKNKIVTGNGGGKFAPNSPITREQMALIMANYAKVLGYKFPVLKTATAYADNSKISSWAKDAVTAMQKADIITGKDGNRFDPQGSATRAEAATILRRFVENVVSSRDAEGWSNANNDLNKRVYYNQNGIALTGWRTIGGSEYNFGSDGVMRTGWAVIADKRYYFDKNGKMITGKWVQISGKWYYFYMDGTLATNTTIDGHSVGADGAKK